MARKNENPGTIDVTVIQAHREIVPGGGYVNRAVGDEIRIDGAAFCANLHRRKQKGEFAIGPADKKEEIKNDTGT